MLAYVHNSLINMTQSFEFLRFKLISIRFPHSSFRPYLEHLFTTALEILPTKRGSNITKCNKNNIPRCFLYPYHNAKFTNIHQPEPKAHYNAAIKAARSREARMLYSYEL